MGSHGRDVWEAKECAVVDSSDNASMLFGPLLPERGIHRLSHLN
jgi:hypothetical protein